MLKMNLSQDILLKVAATLPKNVQFALIDDSPVGRYCCGEIFHTIQIGLSNFGDFIDIEFDPAFHHLLTVRASATKFDIVKEPVHVSSYDWLRARYPFYVPNTIVFASLSDLDQFCQRFGDEIHRFKRIVLKSFKTKGEAHVADMPVLENMRDIILEGDDSYESEVSHLQIFQNFNNVDTVFMLESHLPPVELPKLKSLITPHFDDYSGYPLESLQITDDSEFNGSHLPKTLKHLMLDSEIEGDLDLSSLALKSFHMRIADVSDINRFVFHSHLPQTLTTLLLDAFSYDPTDYEPLKETVVLPNLVDLSMFDIPTEVLRCIEAPKLKKLDIEQTKGPVSRLKFPNLERLRIWYVQLDEDFEFPPQIISLELANDEPRLFDLSALTKLSFTELFLFLDGSEVKLPDSLTYIVGCFPSFVCPPNLDKLDIVVESDIQIDFNESLKDLRVTLRGEDVDACKLIDNIPTGLLSLELARNTSSVHWAPDLISFEKFNHLVSMKLSGMKLADNNVFFPPQLVSLKLPQTEASSLPMIPNLEFLHICLGRVWLYHTDLPPMLRSLSLSANSKYAIKIELEDSTLEYLTLTNIERVKVVKLPPTMKCLTLKNCNLANHDRIDSSLCDDVFRIDEL